MNPKRGKVFLGDVCTKGSSNISQNSLKNYIGKYPIFGASGLIKNVDFYKQENEYIAIVKDGAGIGRTMILPAKSSVISTMQYVLPKKSVNIKYLYYAITAMNLSKYYSGSTIPHIYFRDYQKETFFLPSLNEQLCIVKTLDAIDYLLKTRKKQINALNLLVKSRFIEMFGDPVTNPMGWEMKRLDQISDTRLGKMLDTKKQTGGNRYPYLANFNVQWFRFDLEELNKMDFDEADRAEFALEYGDLLVCEGGEVGRTAIWKNERQDCFFQKAIHRVRCHQNTCIPEYLAWGIYQKAITTKFDGLITSATIAHLTGEKLKGLIMQVPPLSLQNRFAEFVQQVDKSKFVMQKGLEKLELTYKALMQQYFG